MKKTGEWKIRASQGHSIKSVETEALLQPISAEEVKDYPVVVHGTFVKSWKSIKKSGLSKMKRNHIHLAASDDLTVVKSGFRSSCEVLIYIDMAKAMEDGILFYMSSNGVILTEGIDGILSTKYFSQVLEAKTYRRLSY